MKTRLSKFRSIPVGCLVFVQYVGWGIKVSTRRVNVSHAIYSFAGSDVVTIVN